jgi:hypothetical protein
MQNVNVSAVSVNHVFESAGFQIRGKRANCPFCSGSSRLTVSLTGEGLWYCHRCGRGGHIRNLGRELGIALPAPRVRKADTPKREFREWLSRKYSAMARLEHQLRIRAQWASVCLRFDPNHEPAWQALADFYHAERRLAEFFEAAADKIGRYQLYKKWRRRMRNENS